MGDPSASLGWMIDWGHRYGVDMDPIALPSSPAPTLPTTPTQASTPIEVCVCTTHPYYHDYVIVHSDLVFVLYYDNIPYKET